MNLERLRERFFEGLTRYRWQETVGRGGMGIVFKAQDLDLDDVVAIKVLSPDWETDDQQLLLRFKREINLNRKIKHPNVARIHDFGMSNDFPYITMEYVPGHDLRTIIQLEGRLPQGRAISILRQIALGTEAAHKLGIIHRDLKSQNVMLEDNGAVAILDFGLARGKSNEQLTLDSVMVGTPHYMSPEQALGRPTDARSDVYSIGIMAYELLTGKVPYDGESPLVIAMKHVSEPPRDDAKERKRLADVLGRHGCRALEAKDGPEALERLLQDTVDLVLMDVALPGMDGFDVTRVIKAQASSTALPVVLTSARLDRSHFAFAIQTGATDVMAKPLQSEAVVGRLWHILTHHGFQPPAGNEPVLAAMKKTLPSAMTPPSASGKSSR